MGHSTTHTLQAPGEDAPVFIYNVGSVTSSTSYSELMEHVASHGIVAVSVANNIGGVTCTSDYLTGVIDDFADPSESKLPSELRGKLSHELIAVGGHSGGGPCAMKAAGKRAEVVKAVVPQHSAAVPLVNRLSDAEIDAMAGLRVLVLCGTADNMPYCGCNVATKDIHARLSKQSILVEVRGATHVGGVAGESGVRQEGGYVAAFLSYVLKGEEEGRDAVNAGRPGEGDAVDDLID